MNTKHYAVIATVTSQRIYRIEASSKTDALDRAKNMFDSDDYREQTLAEKWDVTKFVDPLKERA